MQNQISGNRIFDGKYLTLKAILPPLNSSNTPTFLLKKHISSHQLSVFLRWLVANCYAFMMPN